jgi:hypothetical protein
VSAAVASVRNRRHHLAVVGHLDHVQPVVQPLVQVEPLNPVADLLELLAGGDHPGADVRVGGQPGAQRVQPDDHGRHLIGHRDRGGHQLGGHPLAERRQSRIDAGHPYRPPQERGGQPALLQRHDQLERRLAQRQAVGDEVREQAQIQGDEDQSLEPGFGCELLTEDVRQFRDLGPGERTHRGSPRGAGGVGSSDVMRGPASDRPVRHADYCNRRVRRCRRRFRSPVL